MEKIGLAMKKKKTELWLELKDATHPSRKQVMTSEKRKQHPLSNMFLKLSYNILISFFFSLLIFESYCSEAYFNSNLTNFLIHEN